jgi:hypothetical protein
MPHHTPLLSTIVAGLVLAFIFGALAQRIRISLLVGYLAGRHPDRYEGRRIHQAGLIESSAPDMCHGTRAFT